jgi:hypothetical protein
MAYTINLTDGSVFAVVADGTINTASSMTLVGKNYAGYGEFLDENFIHLLENSANSTSPGAPLIGQLWFDKSSNTLKVYNGTSFKRLNGAQAATSAPSNSIAGDLWYNSINEQLYVYTGSTWILVGPAFTAGTGTTGAIVDTIQDTSLVDHVVIKLFVANQVVGIVSKDASFTPQVGISGFSNVNPGITLATSVSGVNQFFQGTATNSQLLENLNANAFMRATAVSGNVTSTVNAVTIDNDNGLEIGVDGDLSMTVSGSTITIANKTNNGNIAFNVNDGGVDTTVFTLYGANAVAGFGNALEVSSIAKSGSNTVGNIGSSSNWFDTVYATATEALYADVAERFAADRFYEPGTVVELGGTAEITEVKDPLSNNVFGVISTRAAFLMNGGAGNNETHPPVAMTGRVPVRVIGAVKKGDRLVSAGNGLAKAASFSDLTAYNSIGRALESKDSLDIGLIEAIVTIK